MNTKHHALGGVYWLPLRNHVLYVQRELSCHPAADPETTPVPTLYEIEPVVMYGMRWGNDLSNAINGD